MSQDPFFKLYLKNSGKPAQPEPQSAPPAKEPDVLPWEHYAEEREQRGREDYMKWVEAEVEDFRLFNLYPRTEEERQEWIEARLQSYLAPKRALLEDRHSMQRERLQELGASEEDLKLFESRCAKERVEFEHAAARQMNVWRNDLVPYWDLIPATTEEEFLKRNVL